MKITEVMTRDVETVSPQQTVREAAAFMLSSDAGGIPVVEDDRVIGMITDRDIAVRGVAEGRGPDTQVRELMTADVTCASEDDDVEDIAMRMSDEQVRRLPVVDQQGKLIGIVTLADISRSDQGEAASVALGGITDPGGEHSQSQDDESGSTSA